MASECATNTSLGELRTAQPAPGPAPAEVRAWARQVALDVADRGRLRPAIVEAYQAAHTTPA